MEEIGIESLSVEAIRDGSKTVEVRLGKPRFLKIQEDDILNIREDIWQDGEIIGSHDDPLQIKVTQILYFESYKELLGAIDYKTISPLVRSEKEALEAFRRFYSSEDEEEYGVVAFFFEVI
jgi:ASC-1-like (ASCH) protein